MLLYRVQKKMADKTGSLTNANIPEILTRPTPFYLIVFYKSGSAIVSLV